MARIVMNSGAPRIEGTRISVYDVMDCLRLGWHHSSIALWLGISSAQVHAAISYIEQNRVETSKVHDEILEQDARGNAIELRTKLESFSGTAARLRDELATRKPSPSVPAPSSEGVHAEPASRP